MAPRTAKPASPRRKPKPASSLVDDVAIKLHRALVTALDHALPPPRRMTTLRERLGLDKSLASRVHRASTTTNPLRAIAEGPGVPGYHLLLERLHDCAPGGGGQSELARAIDQLERTHELFPNGRRGFDAALVGLLPESRERGERRARQQIYQATLHLTGIEVDVAYQAYAYAPSPDDPTGIDLGHAEVRQDVRRVREGSGTALTGVPFIIRLPDQQHDGERIETLAGTEVGEDAQAALLTEFCSSPIPALPTLKRGGGLLLIAPGTVPTPGERMTLTSAVVGRRLMPRHGPGHVHNSIVFRKAVRVLIIDLLVEKSLDMGPPSITVSMASGGGPPILRPSDDNLGVIPMVCEAQVLADVTAGHTGGLKLTDARNIPALADRLLRATAPSGGTFRVHRFRIEYPVPHARHLVWLSLPT